MQFKRKNKREFGYDVEKYGEEFFKQKCYLCKEAEWIIDGGHDDNDSFTYLDGLGCKDGYALVCQRCFDKHFSKYSYRYVRA